MKPVLKLLVCLLVTIFFFSSCQKKEVTFSGDTEILNDAMKWFKAHKAPSITFERTTAKDNYKMPIWEAGVDYKVGKMRIIEFPLISNKKRVYITEKLTEAEKRVVIDNIRVKIIFFRNGSNSFDTRIIQFTPSLAYIKAKNYDLSKLTLNNYLNDFQGDFMMFDFDGNFKMGYHIDSSGRKAIKLNTDLVAEKFNSKVSKSTISQASDGLCDNNTNIEPGCTYTVTTTYEITCTNGWNPYEGYNPSYCNMVVVWIECELSYCNGDGQLDDCLESGSDDCMCIVYGICGTGNGGCTVENCNPSAVSDLELEFNSYVQSTSSPSIIDAPISASQTDPIIGTVTWNVVTAAIASWRVEASTDYKYYHTDYTTVDLVRTVDVFNLFHFNTFSSSFIGSNSLITSTWTQTNATSATKDLVFNNNTTDCYGVATVSGTLEHKMAIPFLDCSFCPKMITKVEAHTKQMTLTPR